MVSGYIRYWTSAVRNILAMEQFSRTTNWTWDSRCGGTLKALWLWLNMLGMSTVADRISGITIILLSCHCCLISNARTDICVVFLYLWFVDLG